MSQNKAQEHTYKYKNIQYPTRQKFEMSDIQSEIAEQIKENTLHIEVKGIN